MYFYHETYHDAYSADAALDLGRRDRADDDRTYDPIRLPAILTWLAVVSVALCVIAAVTHGLS